MPRKKPETTKRILHLHAQRAGEPQLPRYGNRRSPLPAISKIASSLIRAVFRGRVHTRAKPRRGSLSLPPSLPPSLSLSLSLSLSPALNIVTEESVSITLTDEVSGRQRAQLRPLGFRGLIKGRF